jgi:serine phosphatase RsbU (regulator of sigma subunit)
MPHDASVVQNNAVNLRTKLIVAFLLISVVPLAAVTFLSYSTSLRAFKKTVEAEAGSQAAEMGRRMASVTDDLARRVDTLVGTPAGEALLAGRAPGTPASKELSGNVASSLGESLALLDRLEFTPPPAGNKGAGEDSDPANSDDGPPDSEVPEPPEPPEPGEPEGPAAFVFDFSSPEMKKEIDAQIARAREDVERGTGMTRAEAEKLMALATASKAMELGRIGIAKDAAAGVDGAKIALQALEMAHIPAPGPPGKAGELRVPETPSVPGTNVNRVIIKGHKGHGNEFRYIVRRSGQVIGKVDARLNLDRTLGAVLSMARSDQGEIPFAVDTAGAVYTPEDSDRATLNTLDLPARAARSGPSGTAGASGDWLIATRQDASGVTFGIARPVGGPLREIRKAYGRNLALGLGVIAAAFAGIVPLSARMTRNLNTLAGGVDRIAKGDLGTRVAVRSRDEFGRLAQAFNRMAEDLAAHEKSLVERERLRRELELCRQIQSDMLPKNPLRLGVAEIRGVSIPAREVGGDFFNYFVLDSGEIALLVGDVSGKGVGAALLMANVQATLRARLPVDPDLVRLCDAIDRELERSTPREVYLTLFVGLLDPRAQTLRYVNAGHNPQYLIRADGTLEKLSSTGMPLGLFAGHGYAERAVTLADGDLLFFYTDGTTEAENKAGEMFGPQRLEPLLRESGGRDIDTLLAYLEEAVREFRGGAEPSDDATMMALRVGPDARA